MFWVRGGRERGFFFSETKMRRSIMRLGRRSLTSSPSGVRTPSYEGEVVIVTGGSSGIGLATVERFAEAGASVYSFDRSPPQRKTSATHLDVDMQDVAAIQGAVDEITKTHDRIDVLVANAGKWTGRSLVDVDEALFDEIVAINVKGTFFTLKAVVPSMLKQQDGAIIILGSDQSLIGKPEQNLYGLTKAAVAQLAKSCAAEFAPHGIRVNCVAPGTIDTPFVDGAVNEFAKKKNIDPDGLWDWLKTAQPYPRLGHPDEVAALITTLPKIPFIVGSTISIDGGYTCQ